MKRVKSVKDSETFSKFPGAADNYIVEWQVVERSRNREGYSMTSSQWRYKWNQPNKPASVLHSRKCCSPDTVVDVLDGMQKGLRLLQTVELTGKPLSMLQNGN